MARTKDGKRDLEAEVINRCVRALELRGRYGIRCTTQISDNHHRVKRVLVYLATRYGVTL